MRLTRNLMLVLSTLLPGQMAGAVGLGAIEVNSYLNQPLDVTIPLVSAEESALADVEVGLASAEDFSRIGLQPPASNGDLSFTLASRGGRPVVHVTSESPIREPFLSLLVRVEWPQGQLLREFTVLLDPPVTAPQRAPGPQPFQADPESEPEAVVQDDVIAEETVAPVDKEPEVTQRQAEPVQQAQPADTAPRGGEYGPVNVGESLWSIASETRPAGFSVNEMMLALLRANPDAFYEQNVNALKRGAVLRIPAQAQIEALNRREVLAQIQRQHALWQDYRLRQAETTPAVIEGGDPAPRVAVETETEDQPRLDLVPPREPAESVDADQALTGSTIPDTEAEVAALRDELARTREELLARRAQTGELDSRVIELEQQVNRLQRLLELKNNELAALQGRAVEEPVEPIAPGDESMGAEGTVSDDGVVTDEPPADQEFTPVDDAELDPFEDPFAAPENETQPFATEATDEPGTTAEERQPAKTPAQTELLEEPATPESELPAEQAPPPERENWLNNLLSPLVVGIIGLALLAIGVALVLFRRRQAQDEEYAGDTTLKRAALEGDTSRGTGSASLEADAQMVPDEEYDDEAAFRARLAEHPEDTEARAALLTLYAARDDREAFINEAETLYAQLADPHDPLWQQVRDMGEEVAPDHPLFKGGFAGEEDLQQTATDEFESIEAPATKEPVGETALSNEPDAPEPESPATAEAEFESDMAPWRAADHEPAPDPEADSGEEALPDREYDLEDLTNEGEKDEWEEAARDRGDAPDDNDIAAPLADVPNAETTDESADTLVEYPAADEPDISSTPEPTREESHAGESLAAEDDAIATKLELAEAYIEMGDHEGARGMLDEVLEDGNSAQQAEAGKLLEKLI